MIIRTLDQDTKALVSRVSVSGTQSQDSRASSVTQNPRTPSVLSLDTFLFAPIVQMGPLRPQGETYAQCLVWDIIRDSAP